jgi:methylated-DNA-[protein]-cysteine S-methyltransferase
MTHELFGTSMESPIGALRLVANAQALVGLYLAGHGDAGPRCQTDGAQRNAILIQAKRELDAYFKLKQFEFAVPIQLQGTPFQCEVWRALQSIPFGETRSYGWLAAALGRPKAARAVGLANGQNPISIIVPCHRVIGHDGDLRGYAGGLTAKRWLLAHEALGQKGPSSALPRRGDAP